jgi:hypothetical protein
VETAAQAAFLLKESCEEAQGYLYAKPLPAAEFEVYLKGRRLGLPAEGSIENAPQRGRSIAGNGQGSLTRRKLRRI